jgi:hypothetical protein
MRREAGEPKIVCLSIIGDTLVQENYSNLHLLVTRGQQWVVAQFDQLCDILTKELEPEQYETLLAHEGITIPPRGWRKYMNQEVHSNAARGVGLATSALRAASARRSAADLLCD